MTKMKNTTRAAHLSGHGILMIAIGLLAGCATTSGTNVTKAQLAKFKVGTTTEAQVIAALGPPDSTMTYPDGSKMDTYDHISSSVNPATFIPFVGILDSGASMRQNAVTITFNSNGTLKSVLRSTNHQNFNSGILNSHE